MKKKLFTCFALLGLGLTSVFTSPIVSHAEKVSPPETSVKLAAETREGTVTAGEIEAYMNANPTANNYFWMYKALINSTNWKRTIYSVGYSINDMGEPFVDDGDDGLPNQLDFKKGKVYLVNARYFTGGASSDVSNESKYSYDTDTYFSNLYCLPDGTTGSFNVNNYLRNNSTKSSLYEENLWDDLSQGEYSDESKWDNRISQAILDNFRTKLSQIYSGWGGSEFKYQSTHLFIPKNDFSLVFKNDGSVNNYPASELYIHESTLMSADYTAPSIGGTVHVSVNVDSQPTIDEILSHVKAIDETDGEVPVTLVSSTYEQGVMEVGDYIIKVSAKDAASNTSTADITVHRYDNTAPVIAGKDSYDLNYDHDITFQKVLDGLTITDNVDSNLKFEVVSDSFTGHEHELGNYQIVVKTKDLSNNYSINKTISLSVKNKGTAVITAPKEITVTISQPLTLEQLKERISVEDGYDGIITNYNIAGFDEYTTTSGIVGTNAITITYTNSGNNTATATTSIKKLDDKAPGIYFDSGYFVMLPKGQEFTLEKFKEHAARVLMISPEEIESIEGTFDTNTVGEYTMKVKLSSGSTETFNVIVGNVQSKTSFHWKDIFTKFFWQSSYNNFLANMTKPASWNWMNWTLVVIVGLFVLAAVGGVIFYKKKKNG